MFKSALGICDIPHLTLSNFIFPQPVHNHVGLLAQEPLQAPIAGS